MRLKVRPYRKTVKKQRQEMTKEVLEGVSRFICLGCIFLKSLNVFYNVCLTFSLHQVFHENLP